MQIKISGRHGHVPDAMRELIQSKVEKLLHYHDRIEMIEVTVEFHQGARSNARRVEILVNAEHKHDLVSHADNEEIAVALDAAVERMKHLLTKYKEKIQDHRRDPARGETK